jgi:hypothetical protein
MLFKYSAGGKIEDQVIRDRIPQGLSWVEDNRPLDAMPDTSSQPGKTVKMAAKKIVGMVIMNQL